MMHLALDYDHTYTAAPSVWDAIIVFLKAQGHRVSVVTFRDEAHDWTDDLTHLHDVVQVPVYCTRGCAKKPWCEARGIDITIWVDDRPAGILADSTLSPSQLEEWRAADQASRGERPAA